MNHCLFIIVICFGGFLLGACQNPSVSNNPTPIAQSTTAITIDALPTTTPWATTPPIPSPTTAPPIIPTSLPPLNLIPDYRTEAVILTGADLPTLVGISPQNLTAWQYNSNGWQQVPVQIDERAWIDLGNINNRPDQVAPVILSYTDPNYQAGADPDPSFDTDDELVFMVKDLGNQPQLFSAPAHTLPQMGVHLTLTHPTSPNQIGHLYLFIQDGALDPAAGQSYVTYQFVPVPNENKNKEQVDNNPYSTEDSQLLTPFYRLHFSARWVMDELNLFMDGNPTSNLIDRLRMQLQPGDCDRTENSFSNGRGFFLVNKSGAVRAIRDQFGANSGSYTQQQQIFYEQQHQLTVFVRVHSVPGMMQLMDYGAAALGMRYYNNLNLEGVVIDGLEDEVSAGTLQWELVTGNPGSLFILHQLETDMPKLNISSFYQDQTNIAPCTGDSHTYGTSGSYYFPLVCTDPARAAVDPNHCPIPYNLTMQRVFYYAQPHLSPEVAQQRYNLWQTPLNITIETIK